MRVRCRGKRHNSFRKQITTETPEGSRKAVAVDETGKDAVWLGVGIGNATKVLAGVKYRWPPLENEIF